MCSEVIEFNSSAAAVQMKEECWILENTKIMFENNLEQFSIFVKSFKFSITGV